MVVVGGLLGRVVKVTLKPILRSGVQLTKQSSTPRATFHRASLLLEDQSVCRFYLFLVAFGGPASLQISPLSRCHIAYSLSEISSLLSLCQIVCLFFCRSFSVRFCVSIYLSLSLSFSIYFSVCNVYVDKVETSAPIGAWKYNFKPFQEL